MQNPNEIKEYTKTLSILFAEDHEALRTSTTEILKSIFQTVDSCANGQEAFDRYIQYKEENGSPYDIVLSDIEMPLMDGIELTENIYKRHPSQSIIILSAYDETRYLLKLINLGIDQFIKKPIDYQELLKSFLTVAKKLSNTTYIQTNTINLSENIIYNMDSKEIINNGESIYLTKFEIIFMELLASHIGKIYSNEDIVSHFESINESIDSANIRKLVSKLRKKLPENSLESIYGIGYKLLSYYNN